MLPGSISWLCGFLPPQLGNQIAQQSVCLRLALTVKCHGADALVAAAAKLGDDPSQIDTVEFAPRVAHCGNFRSGVCSDDPCGIACPREKMKRSVATDHRITGIHVKDDNTI